MAAQVVVGVRKVAVGAFAHGYLGPQVEVREPLGALREAGATPDSQFVVSRGRRPWHGRAGGCWCAEGSGWPIWRMGTSDLSRVREPLGPCARPARAPDSQYGVSRGRGPWAWPRRWLLVCGK